MVDLNAGWPGDRDRLEDVLNVAAGVWRPVAATPASFGQVVALPVEAAGEVDRRLMALASELAPRGEMGRILVKRITVTSVRMERSVANETATLAEKVRRAESDFDEARLTEADHLLAWISSEPATHHRRLTRTPEGIDRLVATLRGLKHDLRFNRQTPEDRGTNARLLDECTGRRSSVVPASRGFVLAEAMGGDFRRLADTDGVDLNDYDRRAWAQAELGKLIEGEIARLESLKATLDLRAIALDRSEAGQRATFDPGKEAVLARRYEAATERSMYRALSELRQINAEAEARGIEPIPPASLLASFRVEGADPAAPPLASFRLDARGPLELPPVPAQTPMAAALAALAESKIANNPALVGFVPPERVGGPVASGSGIPRGPESRNSGDRSRQ